jgi:hypothetical protein
MLGSTQGRPLLVLPGRPESGVATPFFLYFDEESHGTAQAHFLVHWIGDPYRGEWQLGLRRLVAA